MAFAKVTDVRGKVERFGYVKGTDYDAIIQSVKSILGIKTYLPETVRIVACLESDYNNSEFKLN